MCGIAGILGGSDVEDRRRRVERMARALVHRGPDDEGFFDNDGVTLGFRRLSVIDLETGQQPIVLDETDLAIVLNGEIYNYRELRRELEKKGHRFRSSGDVEVVLRLWAEEGPACLARLNGMFALAVWDGARHALHLARDRFGVKPLYLSREKGVVAFASEIRALRAGGFPSERSLDPIQLRHYLAYGYFSPAGAPLEGVQSLPPASLLTINTDGGERLRPYWAPPPPDVSDGAIQEGVVERLRTELGNAVERQLVADVPVGVFLSGGLDSSTLSALARQRMTGALRTFSVGFEGPGSVSELPAAREIAGFLESDHSELMMDPETVARDLEGIVDGLDTPLADPTAIPTWYMSRLARERVTVALSGEGADEVFGGYARQRYDVALDRLGGAGRRILPPALWLVGRPPSKRLTRRLEMEPELYRQLDWGRVFSAVEIDRLLEAAPATEGDLRHLYPERAERWRKWSEIDPVNGRLEADRCLFLAGDLLPKVDRMSMAHSLEVRVPYLDNEVADLVLALPGRFKQTMCRDKIILRKVASNLLPRAGALRRKRGFEVPIGAWLRGSLQPKMREWLAATDLARHGVLRPREVARLVEEHLSGVRDNGRALWTLLVLTRWLESGSSA
jgi:asparagine synthase (glutamine-hydrolysing)